MTEEQKQLLFQLIVRALAACGAEGIEPRFERPKQAGHGDLATSAAMQCAKRLGRNPRELAADIVAVMKSDTRFSSLLSEVEIAGPGFINMKLSQEAKICAVRDILRQGKNYGHTKRFEGQSVLLEFVSANPTGPLHLGHARQGALGDVLARVMASQGYKVTREFYYNDAGVQIHNLMLSVQARGRELLGLAKPEDFFADGYRGDYVYDIARDYLAKKTVITNTGDTVESQADIDDEESIRRYAVAYLRNEQDNDLKLLDVSFDNFYLESSLYTSGRVQKAVDAIIASGHTYEANGALWLKTTDEEFKEFHDDKDRVMRKHDGYYTYFVPDVAYHLAKFDRGFTRAINIQGSDHHGTVARVRIGLQAAGPTFGFTIPKTFPEYLLHKMIRVFKDGEEVKMSKRAGTYITLRDLVDMIGRDAARYFLVSRKSDAEFVIDIAEAREKSNKNPVYYLQYAHARICSVLHQATEKGFAVPSTEAAAAVNLSSLESAEAFALAARLAAFGSTLEVTARDLSPHLICVYLKDLAADFHTFYNAERVLVDDEAHRNARLALCMATRQVLANGLDMLGISAPEWMEQQTEEADEAAPQEN